MTRFRLFAPAIAAAALIGGPVVAAATTEPPGTEPTGRGPSGTEFALKDARPIAVSPDGRLVAARAPSSGATERLCFFELATSIEQGCADLGADQVVLDDTSLVWAPDSSAVAFAEPVFARLTDGDIWLVDAASLELRNLTDDGYEGRLPFGDEEPAATEPIHADVLPAWAPDSASLAISRSTIDADADGTFGNDLVSVDVVTGDVTSLVTVSDSEPGVVYFGLAWAPNGEDLYYSVAFPDPDEPDNGVGVLDATTSETAQLLGAHADWGAPAAVSINATGSTALIVYPLAMQSFGRPQPGMVAVMDVATGDVTNLEPEAAAGEGDVVTAATFSPDGTEVAAYVSGLEQNRLTVRNLDDGAQRDVAVVTLGAWSARPASGLWWTADESLVAATGSDGGTVLDVDLATL